MASQIISPEGYKKLNDELETLVGVRRREIADRIEAAKELGDLSENAEYAEAKEAQAFNEGRISEISALIKNLVVVENAGSSTIGMGSKVTVEVGGAKKDFTIVSFNEADPLSGKISNESPLGMAVLGQQKGAKVVVKTPKGEVEYKIIDVK